MRVMQNERYDCMYDGTSNMFSLEAALKEHSVDPRSANHSANGVEFGMLFLDSGYAVDWTETDQPLSFRLTSCNPVQYIIRRQRRAES